MESSNSKKYVGEFLGTFILVFFGCGTAMFTGANVIVTSLAFGISIIIAAYTVGKYSGCHLNPAVSFAMVFDGKLSIAEFLKYLIAQCSGSLFGTLLLALIVKTADLDFEYVSFGANGFGELNFFGALIVEIILTFVFVLVIFSTTQNKDESVKKNAPIFIAIALVFVHLMGINLTGTSVNPARSIFPAIFAIKNTDWDSLKELWVFIVGPLVGAVLASVVNTTFIREKSE